jgi:hypothetical protein
VKRWRCAGLPGFENREITEVTQIPVGTVLYAFRGSALPRWSPTHCFADCDISRARSMNEIIWVVYRCMERTMKTLAICALALSAIAVSAHTADLRDSVGGRVLR